MELRSTNSNQIYKDSSSTLWFIDLCCSFSFLWQLPHLPHLCFTFTSINWNWMMNFLSLLDIHTVFALFVLWQSTIFSKNIRLGSFCRSQTCFTFLLPSYPLYLWLVLTSNTTSLTISFACVTIFWCKRCRKSTLYQCWC